MMKAPQATSSYVIPQSGFIGVRGLTTSDRRGKRNRRHQRRRDLRGEVVAEVVLARTDYVLDTV
jgi:hypothetical protein